LYSTAWYYSFNQVYFGEYNIPISPIIHSITPPHPYRLVCGGVGKKAKNVRSKLIRRVDSKDYERDTPNQKRRRKSFVHGKISFLLPIFCLFAFVRVRPVLKPHSKHRAAERINP
jgi:hypothetical protein